MTKEVAIERARNIFEGDAQLFLDKVRKTVKPGRFTSIFITDFEKAMLVLDNAILKEGLIDDGDGS